MAYRAILVSAERFAQERLYAHDTIAVADVRPGDDVVLVAGLDPPVAFAVGRAVQSDLVKYSWKRLDDPPAATAAVVTALRQGPTAANKATAGDTAIAEDTATAADGAGSAADGAGSAADRARSAGALDQAILLDEATFAEVQTALGVPAEGLPTPMNGQRVWMVSLDLPIEAPTPVEAVRRFWSYVRELGPVELPTFVSPAGDELAMQAFVLGEEANLDPEEG